MPLPHGGKEHDNVRMTTAELAAWLRLDAANGIGRVTARRLLAAFGDVQSLLAQSPTTLERYLAPAQARALLGVDARTSDLLDATNAWLGCSADDALARVIVPIGHPIYPTALLDIEDPPLLLYMLGSHQNLGGTSFPVDYLRVMAIVGSRNPTPQGAENARSFSAALRGAGFCIVSGLAAGIDAAAHLGALEGLAVAGQAATLAVVGTGLDRVYPARHRDLAHKIATNGVIISEYAIGTPPLAANFPRRNRLIAGLAAGVLVVEAAPASGSLITARMASEQGREVFAIPGSIHAIQSRGCHALIQQGAKLVETLNDILEELPPPTAVAPTNLEPTRSQSTEHPLLIALGFEPTGLDALQARTGLATAQLQVQLLEAELSGDVVRLPGGLFQRMVRA